MKGVSVFFIDLEMADVNEAPLRSLQNWLKEP